MSCVTPFHKGLLFLGLLAVTTLILGGCTSSANSLSASRQTLTAEGEGTATATAAIPTNKAPVVNLLTSNSIVGFGSQVTLTAEAIDPDGDALEYNWSASSGVIVNQTANQITWKAPDAATSSMIKCSVADPKGAQNQAQAQIDVVGGRVYRLNLSLNRSSLYAGTLASTDGSEWVPLAQAKVTLADIDQVGISDATGKVEFNVDAGVQVASQTRVVVRYLDWEARYTVVFPSKGSVMADALQFYPGFDGVTVAIGRGDSFATRRGGVEVSVVEQTAGEDKPLSEVTVQVGAGQQTALGGIAFLSTEVPGSEAVLRVTKSGYRPVSGYRIPVVFDGLTLVRTTMLAEAASPRTDATVAWTRPFNGQKAVPVTGPFEIGFGQPMEKSTIFNDLEMVIQESESRTTLILNGTGLANRFTATWDGDTLLRLTPKAALKPLKKYSFSVARWTAHAQDGRVLKSYAGMFGSFTTDSDGSPVVVSTSPRNGDTGFPRSGPFVLTFDRPMDPATLKSGLTIEVTNVQTGARVTIDGSTLEANFAVTWAADDTVLSLAPRKQLRAYTPYLVKLLGSGLKSRSGRSVEQFANLWGQFTTGAL
ncbi:MAG: Ig-like domain-containing protein [Candidatus Riflebacteria bacterium]|nr:Ig-like domain-containing protein [Candidatus Riflebacteria bacterium]